MELNVYGWRKKVINRFATDITRLKMARKKIKTKNKEVNEFLAMFDLFVHKEKRFMWDLVKFFDKTRRAGEKNARQG